MDLDFMKCKLLSVGALPHEIDAFIDDGACESMFFAFFSLLIEEDRSGERAEKRAQRAINRKLKSTPSARLLDATRARIWAALKGRSDGKLFSRLGYSVDDLMEHLEKQFKSGMNWGNYGKWHVDHIKPCILFDQHDPDQFEKCWALNNLQPLWASDNVRKGSKYGGA